MVNPSYKVFVSHGGQDTWVATQIAAKVRESGADVFLDELGIQKGDKYKEVIHREINCSQELVVLFTPWSSKRHWVWVEIGAAWALGKRILAVLYGISIHDLKEQGGSATVLDDVDVVEINQFERYFRELHSRVVSNHD